jgi:predicted component of type VI protein secretion system
MRLSSVAIAAAVLSVMLACAGNKTPVEVAIVGVDYAYQAPQHIAAGPTAFTFANHGSVLHEIQLFRLRSDVSTDSAIYYLATSEQTDTLAPDGAGSVLWAPAGKAAHERILVDAEAGTTYAVFCQFQNADSLPMHTKLGMIALIHVD